MTQHMSAEQVISEINLRMTEKELQAHVVAFARHHNWSIYHTYDSRRSQPGFPDLVLVRERVVWAELKTEKGRITEAQRSWVLLLEHAGCEAYIWRPSDWPAICEVLACDGEPKGDTTTMTDAAQGRDH